MGDPLLDVGYFLASVPEPGDPLTPVQAFGDGDARRAGTRTGRPRRRVRRRTGRDLSGLAWYTVMAQWKLAVLYEYSRRRAARGDGDPYYADPALVASFLRGRAPAAAPGLPDPRRRRGPTARHRRRHRDSRLSRCPGRAGYARPARSGSSTGSCSTCTGRLGPPHRSSSASASTRPADVVDGFAIVVDGPSSGTCVCPTELSAATVTATEARSVRSRGEVVEPMRTWHVALGPNPAGLEFDLTWRARTPAWSGDVAVANADGAPRRSSTCSSPAGTTGRSADRRAGRSASTAGTASATAPGACAP